VLRQRSASATGPAGPVAVRPRPGRRLARELRRSLPAYLLIAPAILATGLFLWLPIVLSGYWSFTEFNGIAPPHWVGLQNYRDLAGDPRFHTALKNTVEFVFFGMLIGPVLGLGSALLLNQNVRMRALFRTAYFLPVMTSFVVVATIWKILLNEHGLVNQALSFVSLPTHTWLNDPNTALPAIIAASIWQGFGFETIVFLAALQAIPREYYEAAQVDGAGGWTLFRHITLPGLRPTVIFVYIIGIIGSFQVFDQIFVMTQGGPFGSTRTIVFELYDRFNSLELGPASAIAYVLLLILAILSYIQLRVFEERD
jgi:multiple sugar transport system permease protein